MSKSYGINIIIFIGLMFSTTPSIAESLTIVAEDRAPSMFAKDGKVAGASTDMVREALTAANIDATFAIYPLGRSVEMARTNANTCVNAITRNSARELWFKWAGPVNRISWGLVGREDSPNISSLAEVSRYTVGGDASSAFTRYLKSAGVAVEEVGDDALNLKKLEGKRIDFWEQRILGGELPRIASRFPIKLKVKDVEWYLGCNPSVPDAVINRLNESLKKMTSDGRLEEIWKRYRSEKLRITR
jgi:polar amino acid transport system substrate-binding protein